MTDEQPKDPLSKVRHDLRTPINQILGYSELLQEDAEEKGQKSFVPDLQKIQAAARRMLALVDEFLAPGKLVPAGSLPATAPAPAPVIASWSWDSAVSCVALAWLSSAIRRVCRLAPSA